MYWLTRSVNKFQEIDIMWRIFYYFKTIWLQIKTIKGKWDLKNVFVNQRNILPNNFWVVSFLEWNNNKSTYQQNLWYTDKMVLRKKVMTLNKFIKK